MRIAVFVHGRGRGHATRMRPVVEALLARGDEVRVFAAGAAAPVFGGVAGARVEPVEALPPRLSAQALRRFATRFADAWPQARWADVVVSDGDHPSGAAAIAARVPWLAVGHGLVFSHCRRRDELPEAPWRREAQKARATSAGAREVVAVNFIALDRAPGAAARVTVARPRLRDTLAAPGAAPRGGPDRVVGYLSVDAERIVPALRRAAPEARIFSPGGVPGTEPVSEEAFARALASATAVVGTAGSQLLGECAALGIPAFTCFPRAHDEQRLNAAMWRAAGLGDGAASDARELAARITSFLDRSAAYATRFVDAPRPEHDAVDACLCAVDRLAGT